MTFKKISATLFRLASLAILTVLAFSCKYVKDSPDDCGIYLEFIYDHNMEYTDSFGAQVVCVDVFVFDESGTYLFTKHSPRDELIGGRRMMLGSDIPLGTYKILTVGGLSDHFTVSCADGSDLVPGQSTLSDVTIALSPASTNVSHRCDPLWVAGTMDIYYRADLTVWPVHLVKNTNDFNLALEMSAEGGGSRSPGSNDAAYGFRIVTPESAAYGHDNAPLYKDPVTYAPYELSGGSEPGELSVGRLNTVRLLDDSGYRIMVVREDTQHVLWDYDLMKLLRHIKPAERPDGTQLPMQEFLDRQSEWNIVILYKEGFEPQTPSTFIAVAVRIGPWIVWLHDIEL